MDDKTIFLARVAQSGGNARAVNGAGCATEVRQ